METDCLGAGIAVDEWVTDFAETPIRQPTERCE